VGRTEILRYWDREGKEEGESIFSRDRFQIIASVRGPERHRSAALHNRIFGRKKNLCKKNGRETLPLPLSSKFFDNLVEFHRNAVRSLRNLLFWFDFLFGQVEISNRRLQRGSWPLSLCCLCPAAFYNCRSSLRTPLANSKSPLEVKKCWRAFESFESTSSLSSSLPLSLSLLPPLSFSFPFLCYSQISIQRKYTLF